MLASDDRRVHYLMMLEFSSMSCFGLVRHGGMDDLKEPLLSDSMKNIHERSF